MAGIASHPHDLCGLDAHCIAGNLCQGCCNALTQFNFAGAQFEQALRVEAQPMFDKRRSAEARGGYWHVEGSFVPSARRAKYVRGRRNDKGV